MSFTWHSNYSRKWNIILLVSSAQLGKALYVEVPSLQHDINREPKAIDLQVIAVDWQVVVG